MMSKLTLSVNPSVISRAKRYAKRRGVSVSRMVEAYLAQVSEPAAASEMPPVLRSVRGILKKAALADYRKHLREKYR
jgi:hypothetical protein